MLKTLSVAGYLLMVAAVLGLLALHALFSPRPPVVAVQLAAAGLMIWARATFGRRSFHAAADPTEGGLVTRGPYRLIRHPIYTAVCLFAAAGAAAHFSPAAAGLLVLLLTGAVCRIAAEERLLVRKYPEYRDYAARTWRMVPYLY